MYNFDDQREREIKFTDVREACLSQGQKLFTAFTC